MATNRMGDTLIPIEEGRNNDRRRRKTLEDATCFEIVRELFRRIWFCVRSTPTSEDDSLLGNSQEQEMLELRKDNIYYKEAYQQEKRTLDNEVKRYEYEISEAMSKVNALEMSRSDALSRLERAMREINDLRKSKDEALSRLSAMMGAKLRDNNPAITDLNDPNRPMKIGEQFSGVYENEWTDAFLNLNNMKSDDGACINEEEAIVILLNILREVNEKSIIESNLQLSELLQSVQGLPQDMCSEVTKSTKDAHKANAIKYIPVIYKKIMCEDSKCKTVLKYTSHCQSYIEKCLKVCYFAAVQDPPMYLDFEPGEDTYDRQVYKEYTQTGTKVKFLVWPALFLHKGGALISKGVLQPIPDTN